MVTRIVLYYIIRVLGLYKWYDATIHDIEIFIDHVEMVIVMTCGKLGLNKSERVGKDEISKNQITRDPS